MRTRESAKAAKESGRIDKDASQKILNTNVHIPFIVLSGGVREVIEVIFYEMMREQLLKS